MASIPCNLLGFLRYFRFEIAVLNFFVGSHCSLEVNDFISSLTVVDKKVLSRQFSIPLASVVGRWLETVLDFLSMLLASSLSDKHFLFFALLDSSLIKALSIVGS